MRWAPNDSSETESDREGSSAVVHQPGTTSEDTGESSYYGESDSATESDLIIKSFKSAFASRTKGPDSAQTPSRRQQTEPDVSEISSQVTTLLEMSERAPMTGETFSKAKKRKGNRRLTRRGVPMREEFFSKIGWTKSFISGPADPVHNPLRDWCLICKKNFSVKSKSPCEILRHHRTQCHLRRDQRWRYEHLRSTDPITGKVQHRVRGANGKILTKMELANELPFFINEELVDIGKRSHFTMNTSKDPPQHWSQQNR